MEDLQGGTLALEHRYDIDRRVGVIGLFATYLGTRHPFERPVSIKVCEAPAEHSVPEVFHRIKKSAVDAAALDIEGVARVVDFGEIDRHVPFVVSESRPGVSLADLVESEGTLAPERALRLVGRLAGLVQAAHDRGVLHLGLAPTWITIPDDDVERATLDHFLLHPSLDEVRSMESELLSYDVVWPHPPEQFDEEAPERDARTDVWALGAVLYWAVSGVHPYFGDPTDTSEGLLRIKGSRPPQDLAALGFDGALSELVMRALALDRADRFQTVQSFHRAIAKQLGIDERPEQPEPAEHDPANQGAVTEDDREVMVIREPTRVGSALAMTVLLLALTNVGWFIWSAEDAYSAPPAQELAPRSVLPAGVEILSSPPGAQVSRVEEGGARTPFGDTPLTVDRSIVPGEGLQLEVEKDGHEAVQLHITGEREAPHVVVVLPETPAAP